MYVAVKGGETAVKHSRESVASQRRGDTEIPELRADQIEHQMGLAVDRVMAEASLYDPRAAAFALKQAQGDVVEAAFLVRAYRTTLPRFGSSRPVDTRKMSAVRRISGAFKDIPGGQILGPTYDYTHRLIEFEDQAEQPTAEDDASDMGNTGGEKTISNDTEDVQDQQLFADKFKRLPWVIDILKKQHLMKEAPDELIGEIPTDLTREPLSFPASRSACLQGLARGDEGFLLGTAYSLQRGFGLDSHPFLGELRVGVVDVFYTPPELGFEINIGQIKLTECFMINRFNGSEKKAAGFKCGYGLVFGQNERKAMSISLLDRSLQTAAEGRKVEYPAQNQEFVLSHCDNVESSGFVQHLKLPHYVDFQSELVFIRNLQDDRDKGKQS